MLALLRAPGTGKEWSTAISQTSEIVHPPIFAPFPRSSALLCPCYSCATMAVVAAPPWLQEALTSLTQSEAWKQIELLYNSASTEALIATAILGLLTLLLIQVRSRGCAARRIPPCSLRLCKPTSCPRALQAWIFSPSPKLPGARCLINRVMRVHVSSATVAGQQRERSAEGLRAI